MNPLPAALTIGTARPGPALVWAVPALGWLAGSALQLQMPALWDTDWVRLMGAMALLLVLVAWRSRGRWTGLACATAAALTLGFCTTHLRADARLANTLPAALQGQDLVLTGTVASLPREGLDGTRFVFSVETASHQGIPVKVPQLVSLGWYRGMDDDAVLGGPAESVRAGQRWRLTARLRQPHGTLNPHGFDLELWLFEQGIGASGTVRSRPGDEARKLHDKAGAFIQRARQDWRDAIQSRIKDPAVAGVLAALAVGDQAAIEREDWELFRVTGVAHLMSISGLHVTMFAWLAALLVGRLWRLQPRLLLACPAPTAARLSGLVAAVGYALLAGWGVPAQRTVWMIAAVVLLRGLKLRWPLPAVLLAAALVVTVIDPWALLQPGFWLSFVAVGLLVVSEPVQSTAGPVESWFARAMAALRAGLRTQAVATVGLAPLSLVFFQQLSLVGFAANLVAIPLVTVFITPLALLGLLLPPLWDAAAWLVQMLTALLQLLASAPLAVWHAAVAPPWAVASGLLAALLAVLPLPWRLRLLALPLMLPLLAPPVPRPAPGSFELVAADVGQGTAVLVRTANHLLLYDTGPQYSRESDAGVRVLLPLLRARGERQIDMLMLSHRDADHVGGAAAVLRNLPVLAMSSSLVDSHPLRQLGQVPQQRCQAGQAWDWDGVRFEVLHPLASDHTLALKSNAISCVLRVQSRAGSVLLTGDIEAAQEAALVQRAAPALRSSVLLVPHHGSRTSSTAAFLDAVAPQVAVVQAGYRSRYGHPAADVLSRYQARGIQVLRSDQCGAWVWREGHNAQIGPPGLDALVGQAVCTREQRRRYWHHRPARRREGPFGRLLRATKEPAHSADGRLQGSGAQARPGLLASSAARGLGGFAHRGCGWRPRPCKSPAHLFIRSLAPCPSMSR